MVIELVGGVEEQLQDLAVRQGRDIGDLVEEAVREYLEAAAITDLEAEAWDRQFEADVKAGKLDAPAERALQSHAAGLSTKL